VKEGEGMMRLSDIRSGISIIGLEASGLVCTVKSVDVFGEGVLEVVYKLPDGSVRSRLLTTIDEGSLALAETARPWAFDGDASAFQLACEAKRIDLAFLFDPMMAVHASNVDPLPHQITAVYESMLPRQPLRYVLADDPGAGKTVMAGLYIRELMMRADASRILIVAPGSLVEQWQEELFTKFGLEFRIFSSALTEISPSGNPFVDHSHLIVRLDQIARDEEEGESDKIPGPLQQKLLSAGWDLVVFDEAHKLSAHYWGADLKRTGRYRFAERIGRETRHLLLMTATPHNGKEEDFQLFLALLDSDRFYGKLATSGGAPKVDASDLMRRMVKEELLKFDGRPLFPERKAYTVNYHLSQSEVDLYNEVTEYVKGEMGKADNLSGNRRNSVGFALTSLQRRLASSPKAICQSLKRRKQKLSERLKDAKRNERTRSLFSETVLYENVPEDEDDLSAEEQESLEETLVDKATAAQSIQELEAEITILQKLEEQAEKVVASNQDKKWDELSSLLQGDPKMYDASGRQRKIIIFTEHKDTLHYLQQKISSLMGREDAVAIIHGGTPRDERRRVQALFRSDKEVRVLIATDAAGEGVNLQCAHLMVNYDLPWNPNRLEQRFGRIHRIGQTEVCHLWSLVASETREGAVWQRLLDKLATECHALKGKVFNILGEVFENKSLKDLLIEAIRLGDLPETRAKLNKVVDSALDRTHLQELLDRNSLSQETMSAEQLFRIKEEMEQAEARRLQPFFVQSFFLKAFEVLKGSVYKREPGRYEITFVPPDLRERDRRLSGRNRRDREPVLKSYERVTFDRHAIAPVDKPGLSRAVLLHPGHPLLLSITDKLLDDHANLLRQGAVFVDPTDSENEPWLLFLLTHEVKSGDGQVLSKRLQFIKILPDGTTHFAGWAPHLDLEPLPQNELPLIEKVLKSPWITSEQEQRAIGKAATTLVPQHFREVATRRTEHVEKTLSAVHARLTQVINDLSDREIKLKEDLKAGKDVQLPLRNISRQLDDLQSRLERRKKELHAMLQVHNGTPVVVGGALVLPQGLMQTMRGESSPLSSPDTEAKRRIETLAMEAVRRFEEAKGHVVKDVSLDKCGWDLTSYPPPVDGIMGEPKHIEVKGRMKGASTITVTKNEILYAFNQREKFILAIVFINEDDSINGPYYITNPFSQEPDWGVASVNYTIADLLQKCQ
jgi:superfamily II DNA or RNA helicase